MASRSRRRLIVRCAVVLGLALSVQLYQAVPSLAVNCGAGYKYAGEYNLSNTYEGLQGEIGLGGAQAEQGAIHFINYYDLSDNLVDCNGDGSCWLQAGYGQGDVGGYTSTSTKRAYFEGNDVNGYIATWSPSGDVLGSSNSSYISLSFVAEAHGNYEYEADSYSTNGTFDLGDVWFDDEHTIAVAQSETQYLATGTCATWSGPFYYGANASGGFGTSSYIEASFNGSVTFSRISNTGWTTHGPGTDMAYTELNGNRYMFKTAN